MTNFRCRIPEIIFGNNCMQDIYNYIGETAETIFLVVDPYLEKTGLAAEITSLLQKQAKKVILCTSVDPNPNCFKVDQAAKVARNENCDMVVAVGGGSAIDFGKGVAVVAANTGQCWDYTDRKDHKTLVPGINTLPVIAIPTTSGTGAEVTPFAVFNNSEIKEKSSIVSDKIFPKFALIDPMLTRSMPPILTALTGIDAFAHSLEGYISRNANQFSKMLSLEAIRLISEFLPVAVDNGNNIEAREKLAWASALGGIVVAHIGGVLPHAMGQPVSGFTGAPHGGSIAACIVSVLESSYEADPDKFAVVAETMDPSLQHLPVNEKAAKCPLLVAALLDKINVNVRYSDYGLIKEDIPKVTSMAFNSYYGAISRHPKEFSVEEVEKIFHKCL